MSEKTAAIDVLLTNQKGQNLTLISSSITGSSSTSKVDFPQNLEAGSTSGGIGASASDTPYEVEWSYSPDNGATLLNFKCELNGARGIQIIPSKTGPESDKWTLGESPSLNEGVWVVQFYYQK